MAKLKYNRYRAEKRYNKYYLDARINKECLYCGNYADAQDHVPALVQVYNHGIDYFIDKGIPLVRVSSCSECNSILGKNSYTLKARINVVYNRYKEYLILCKERKLPPGFSIKELEEMGRNLRGMIMEKQKFKYDKDTAEGLKNKLKYIEKYHKDDLE